MYERILMRCKRYSAPFQEVPARFLSRPLVGTNTLRSMEIACIYCASQANSCSLKKAPQLHRVRHKSRFFGTYPEASKTQVPIERNNIIFNSHQRA